MSVSAYWNEALGYGSVRDDPRVAQEKIIYANRESRGTTEKSEKKWISSRSGRFQSAHFCDWNFIYLHICFLTRHFCSFVEERVVCVRVFALKVFLTSKNPPVRLPPSLAHGLPEFRQIRRKEADSRVYVNTRVNLRSSQNNNTKLEKKTLARNTNKAIGRLVLCQLRWTNSYDSSIKSAVPDFLKAPRADQFPEGSVHTRCLNGRDIHYNASFARWRAATEQQLSRRER